MGWMLCAYIRATLALYDFSSINVSLRRTTPMPPHTFGKSTALCMQCAYEYEAEWKRCFYLILAIIPTMVSCVNYTAQIVCIRNVYPIPYSTCYTHFVIVAALFFISRCRSIHVFHQFPRIDFFLIPISTHNSNPNTSKRNGATLLPQRKRLITCTRHSKQIISPMLLLLLMNK